MVEAPRVELGSENTPLQASTYLVLIIAYRASVSPEQRSFWRYPAKVSLPARRCDWKLSRVVDVLIKPLGRKSDRTVA